MICNEKPVFNGNVEHMNCDVRASGQVLQLLIRDDECSLSVNEQLRLFLYNFDGEFDPGSGRTLAAWIRHASRATDFLRGVTERRTGE